MNTQSATRIDDRRRLSVNVRKDGPASGSGEDFEISLLNKIAARMSAAAPLHEVLGEVIEFVTAVVKCDSCMLYVFENKELVLRASNNPHPEVVDRLKMKVGQGITGWVAEHREPVVVTRRAYEDPRFKLFNELPEDHFESFPSRSPVVSGGRMVGVINVQNRDAHQHSKREIELIATLGFLVGADSNGRALKVRICTPSDNPETRKLLNAKGI